MMPVTIAPLAMRPTTMLTTTPIAMAATTIPTPIAAPTTTTGRAMPPTRLPAVETEVTGRSERGNQLRQETFDEWIGRGSRKNDDGRPPSL